MIKTFQNLEIAFFEDVAGEYDFPVVEPVYEIPKVNRYIEFDYCKRVRDEHSTLGVHFFEDDCKFERIWSCPDRYAAMLQKFGFIIGPDFSTYPDFPKAMQIFNHYRNRWLVKYWQTCYNMIVVPTILCGGPQTYDWCFDGLPHNSIVAVSNVGVGKAAANKAAFLRDYNYMLEQLEPSKVLFFTRTFEEVPGNIEYIRWEIHKGDQMGEKPE